MPEADKPLFDEEFLARNKLENLKAIKNTKTKDEIHRAIDDVDKLLKRLRTHRSNFSKLKKPPNKERQESYSNAENDIPFVKM